MATETTLPFKGSYWVIPCKLMAGEHPSMEEGPQALERLESLVRAGIRVVINLTQEGESNLWDLPFFEYHDYLAQFGVEVYRMAIRDMSVPEQGLMDEIMALIDRSLDADKPVYFHCLAGVGRTGTVLGCYLLHKGLASPDHVFDVIDDLKRKSSMWLMPSPQTFAQKAFVFKYAGKCPKKSIGDYTGCLVGGAVGDALGAPVEFQSIGEIREKHGESGISGYVEFADGTGQFTDDTQMTLFTAAGLLGIPRQEWKPGITDKLAAKVHPCYLDWLVTQGYYRENGTRREEENESAAGWLMKQHLLFRQRAPGNTCLSALKSGRYGTQENPINNSKGCGTVMKIAPVGLLLAGRPTDAFRLGCEISALTHGHPTGYLSGGFLASVIAGLVAGISLATSIQTALKLLLEWEGHEETERAVEAALSIYAKTSVSPEKVTTEDVESLGGAWVAEEALAISLYASLLYENDFERGVLLAVNHSGDSDSTGAVTGNILGLINGYERIPAAWRKNLEGEEIVRKLAQDLYLHR